MWWYALCIAMAQDPTVPEPIPDEPPVSFVPMEQANDEDAVPDLEVVPPGVRTSIDVVLWVRRDGNYFLHDKLVLDTDLVRMLGKELDVHPDLRLVVSADEQAPYGRITHALSTAREAGVKRIAVEMLGVRTGEPDPLFTPDAVAGAVDLTGEGRAMSAEELKALKPRLFKFPQEPYAHTDFTAYTLERGETRLGLATISHGITPRVQLTTTPVLDVIGVWNAAVKANLVRHGRFDGALTAGIFYVPVADLLNNLGVTRYASPTGRRKDAPTLESSLSYYEYGLRASMRLTEKWSAHAGVSYARVRAQGRITLGRLPSVDIPKVGTIGGQKLDVVPQVIGELAQIRFATDYRFNRRDSLIFQYSSPLWFGARGVLSADSKALPKNFRNLQVTVGYDQWVNLTSFYAASLAWQFSWKHTDLRLGLPVLNTNNPQWFFQAFDLSYRWGGATRRRERDQRRAYRANKRELKGGSP